MEIFDFVARLDSPQQLPSGIAARCPAHDDQIRSLMVNEGNNGGIVAKCHAGCAVEDIVAALGLALSDLMGLPQLVESYPYTDKLGQVLYVVERWANPKTFRCVPALPSPSERVLYQMMAIEWAREHGKTVFVVEGERDVNTLAQHSIAGTTNVGGAGAGKWLPQYNEMLSGLNVVVVADNDAPGKLHARGIAAALKGHARYVTLMHSPHGKDVTDLILAGYSIDALQLLPESDGLATFRASAVASKKVQWAWTKYFPLGKLTLIEGDPGDGKSILTVDLAARWSSGMPMPDGSNGVGPWDVVMISAEDDIEDTIKPRLERAGANLDRVHLIPHGATPDVPFDLQADILALGKYIVDNAIKAVFIDPLSAFMPEKTDTHNDASTRRALQPLKHLAALTGAAVICVRHLIKSGTGKAIYRGGGSIAFGGAARCVFLVARTVEDPEVRVLAPVKNNLTRLPPALSYVIESVDDEPYLRWGEAVHLSAQELLDGPTRALDVDAEDELASKRRAREQEREFLSDVLADGPLSWVEIKTLGKETGFPEINLRRARADLGLVKMLGPGGNASTKWAMPEATQSDGSDPTCSLAQPNKWRMDTPVGEQVSKSAPESHSPYPDGSSDEERDAWLDELPLVCSTCQTTEAVCRFYKPWWVNRCPEHNPLTFGDGI